ncbi:hypothetical protein ART_3836 [Arthrobacter sp. PAMC 25486]|uniref:hypothetical protein n=1 Tax=Arthrobacter sp. PAMC 25486 TaxID=1494608 RepID=UPI000535EC5D|nr:hypothetical protein [Arthrobacter sp. PAMC 25486]AIY03435.1 hypothetical protein ART_3836 [Arthrobacter sp. PAMC 25486]
MAYPMSRAVTGSATVPLPTSPVVWAGYVRKTIRACVVVALLWALAVAMLGFFSPLEISRVFDDVAHFVPALLFVIGLIGALGLGNEIGKDFKHVLGYGVVKRNSEFHGHTVVPRRGRRLAYAAVLSGWLLGCIAAAVIRAVKEDWLGLLLLVGLAVVLVVPTVKMLRLARIMWRKAVAERRTNADIVRDGEHTIGTVVAVTNEEFIVDDRAMFHVDLEYRTGGRLETVRIRFFDYPVWAPAIGNEFDVWSDPERPFVQDRILLERRYVGQKFMNLADEPVPGSHMSGDAAPHPEPDGTVSGSTASSLLRSPQWMADEAHEPSTPKVAQRTRLLIGIPPNLIAVLALLGTLLVPSMIEDVPWWTLAALWLYTVLTIVNAAIYWQFMLRRRWFLRSGVSFGATEAAVFAGFFAAGFAMLTTHSMVFAPLNQEIPWTAAHVLTWAAVIGALLVFEWAFTSNAWALKHLNAEFPAPPEAIQEALTGHKTDGVDQLERDYGYRAGVFLCN